MCDATIQKCLRHDCPSTWDSTLRANKGRKFCSSRCVNLMRWNGPDGAERQATERTLTCKVCGKTWAQTWRLPLRKTCSDNCQSANLSFYHSGKTVSQVTRQKMRQAKLGKNLTEEHRTAIGKANSGSLNSHWIDGRSYSKDDYGGAFTHALRETIRRRDNNACRSCGHIKGVPGRKIFVHHIDGDKLHNEHDNLITLCDSCHSHVHHTHPDRLSGLLKDLAGKI